VTVRARLPTRFGGDWRSRRDDLLASVILTFVAIPAGIGYAQVAGLPAAVGLSTTAVALIAYALVGPSRVYVIGPDSSLAPIIAAALAPLALAGTDRRVALAGLLSLMVGVVLALGGRLHLGRVADLLAKPIRVGFLNGVAVVIFAGQLPRVFGLTTRDDGVLQRVGDLARDLLNGEGSALAAGLGMGTIATWLILRPRLHAAALPLAMLSMTLLGVLLDAPDRVAVVGELSGVIALPAAGDLRWRDVAELVPAALGIALVAFADSVALSRSLADRTGAPTDENDEMTALGVTNVAVGALGGFPVSASSSRTPTILAAGATSQLCCVSAAALVTALAVLAPGATEYVPIAVVSAAVIVAALYLVDLRSLVRLWRVSRAEFMLSIVTFAGVITLDVLRGIGVAIALAIVMFVARFWRPHRAELVRIDSRKGYHDIARHPDGRRIPGLVIARFDAPLFFANAAEFSSFIVHLVEGASTPVRRVILAAEPLTDIDATAADELATLLDRLSAMNISFDFAELKGPVKDKLTKYGLDARVRTFSTIGTAVRAYVRETGTPWVDWEERRPAEGSAHSQRSEPAGSFDPAGGSQTPVEST
jgi:high affinity sulfate transporter 1